MKPARARSDTKLLEADIAEALTIVREALDPVDGEAADRALMLIEAFVADMLPQVQAMSQLHAEVQRLIDYDPETGVFTWKVRSGRMGAGKVGGSPRNDGYVALTVAGVRDLAHRFAWFYVHGMWPDDMIDHKNGQRADNRFENLREADNTLNAQNQRAARKCNATGLLGASRRKDGFFNAQIGIDGTTRWLGKFATAHEAHQAYLKAKRQLHAGCTI